MHWVLPLIKESQDGTPWATGSAQMEAQFSERFPNPSGNVFIQSQRYSEFGKEMLSQFGVVAVVKAWLVGAAINLGAPAVVIAPPVAQLPRTGFYDTKAASFFEKIGRFLFRSDNVLYAWILLIGIAGKSALFAASRFSHGAGKW